MLRLRDDHVDRGSTRSGLQSNARELGCYSERTSFDIVFALAYSPGELLSGYRFYVLGSFHSLDSSMTR